MKAAVDDVVVSSEGPGVLLVRWELRGGDAPVVIGVGPTPETIDHTHTATAEAGERTCRLQGLPGGRQYVSVSVAGSGGAVVVAGERRVPFMGAGNFRDLGGYRTVGGGTTRWGQVFRADSLHALTDDDREAMTALGLRVIYDLRSDTERERMPSVLPDGGVRAVQLPLIGGDRDSIAGLALSDGEQFLLSVYRGMIARSAPVFGRLLRGLAEDGGLPAVFHCAAGKDRTGVSAALLLSLLGVDDDTVLDDYELSSLHRRQVDRSEIVATLTEAGVSPEAMAGLFRAPRWVMETVLGEIKREYGSVEAYVTGPVGLEHAAVARLRDLLVA